MGNSKPWDHADHFQQGPFWTVGFEHNGPFWTHPLHFILETSFTLFPPHKIWMPSSAALFAFSFFPSPLEAYLRKGRTTPDFLSLVSEM